MSEARRRRVAGESSRGVALQLLVFSLVACGGDKADPDTQAARASVYEEADEGCGVIVCPMNAEPCCTQVVAVASDNASADYARRSGFVRALVQSPSEVRADFHFEAADQRGGLVFNLGRQRYLSTLSVLAASTGVASSRVTVTLSDITNSGCVAGFELGPSAAQSTPVNLQDDEFCFLEGTPGSGSTIEFGIFSAAAGDASLTLRRVELRALDLEGRL